MDYSLRPACLEDIQIVLTWVGTADLLRLWGGPALSFPPTPGTVWSTIEATSQNSYSLINSAGQLAGFAQALPRGSSVHLARIIVSPSLRGQGVGRILCQKLIQIALAQHHPCDITLKVYPNNTPAFSLYQSLGFIPTHEAQNTDSIKMCLMPKP
jgi:ribosomal protein S18 acetylase RimI-like enzyme